ncbi:MAG: hypothetical protein AAGA85_16165 [Bacteroidota bacterium]
MNQEQEELLERKCFEFADRLSDIYVEAPDDPTAWRLRQLHFAAVKTGVFVRKSLMHDSRREHAHHMLQACIHALESEYWLQLLVSKEPFEALNQALQQVKEIIVMLSQILKLKNFNPNY